MTKGWGRLALSNFIGSPRSYEYVDQSVLLTTGQILSITPLLQSRTSL